MLRRRLQQFARRLRAFHDDRGGQVLLTFALSALPALIMMGAAIDYSRAVAQRSNLQQATDSTVLAIAHSYLTPTSTCSSLFANTQTYLTGTMNTANPNQSAQTIASNCSGTKVAGPSNAAALQGITFSGNNTTMCITTNMVVPVVMMNIVGFKTMTVGAYACSKIPTTYEVALVLDNSYSMSETLNSGTKMDALHTAATGLVNTLIPSSATQPTTAMSLVPFNALVNVGTSRTASFLDKAGASSLNWIDLTKPAWTTTPSRFTLFDGMYTSSSKTSTVAWGGCVEERPNNASGNYMTTDVAATSGDSLFVPYFAPDDPGGLNNANYNGLSYEIYADSNSNPGSKTNYAFYNSYLADAGYNGSSPPGSCKNGDSYATADNKSANTYPRGGLTMSCKYNGSVPTIATQTAGLSVGPNFHCSTPAITPLTTSNNDLVTAIADMQPEGSTNLGIGFMWGWRTISPVVKPYPVTGTPPAIGQQNPKAYNFGPPANTKIIILMTDGFNSWLTAPNPYASGYEGYGYMSDNRLSKYSTTCPSASNPVAQTGSGFVTTSSGYRCQMDNMLLEACTNAKNATQSIVIYTVAFSVASDPIDDEGRNVLKACASSPANYFEAADGDALVTKFQQIAASITNLRLTQ